MERMKGGGLSGGSVFINMGLKLKEEFPDEANLVTLLRDAPFFEILFISDASSLANKITKKAISRFKAYDALTAKMLKLNKINSFNGPLSDRDAVQCAEHMFRAHPDGVGIFFSKEYQLLCFVVPKCGEGHHSSEEVN